MKLKNFRDKWVGSTESNLEKIFRLLQALGRCFVFVDEADQALGKRDAGAERLRRLRPRLPDDGRGDEQHPQPRQDRLDPRQQPPRPDRGRPQAPRPHRREDPPVPDDHARRRLRPDPGPLQKARRSTSRKDAFEQVKDKIPTLLTPGAAETLSIKVYRHVKTENLSPTDALKEVLADYQNPVPRDVMEFQIGLAVREASDLDFVPPAFRPADGSR